MKSLTTVSSIILASMMFVSPISAAPINITASGVVIDSFGDLTTAPGSSYGVDITIDLNEANALGSETFLLDDPAYKRWYFDVPYYTTYNGNTIPNNLQVEIIDNFDASAFGGIYGLTGTYDVLGIYNGNVSCSVPIDPVTGVCPFESRIGGTDYGFDIFVSSDWFSGIDSLPASIPEFSSMAGVFGWVENYNSSGITGELLIEYYSLNTVSAVPVPAAVWLFGSGLLTLLGYARRKKA